MKRAIVLLPAIILAAFSSCKRNYTCTCTGPIYSSASPTVSTELGKLSKKDAQQQCYEYSFTQNYTDCSIDQ